MNVDAGPHLPIVIEIVDTEENIARFLPAIDGMIESGLVTLEKVKQPFTPKQQHPPWLTKRNRLDFSTRKAQSPRNGRRMSTPELPWEGTPWKSPMTPFCCESLLASRIAGRWVRCTLE